MATNDPAALLDRLCREPRESRWLEFKENNNDPEMIGKRVSACANAAILAGKERAFIVFGVEDGSRRKVGTKVALGDMKKGGENFENWLNHLIEPKLMIELLDFNAKGKQFAIIVIEPTYDRPVKFYGTEWIRIGENTKKLSEFPEQERALWLATGRRKFESAVALPHQTMAAVMELLDVGAYYKLVKEQIPDNEQEIMRRFCSNGFISDDMEGGYDISNLGAILFAKNIATFPSIARKSVRVIRYSGVDKTKSDDEQEGQFGYAVGFAGLIKYIMRNLPREERYINGVREMHSIYPETAVREILANALIHQDFTLSGAAPVVEIYSDRIEITNPGSSLIEVDRIIDDRRSRNEKLAATMRALGICEERGGGIDKAIIEIERNSLPPPEFNSTENSMRVVLFGPRPFSELSKTDRMRACFHHCIIRWIISDFMSNTTLRDRFSLAADDYQAVSAIISESIKLHRIVPADPTQGRRNARYVPYWAR